METKSQMDLVKMQGTGNSFLLTLDSLPNESRAKAAQMLCDVHWGVGADGLVFLRMGEGQQVEWDFYNSDGSKAEFCGNAARCVTLFCAQRGNGLRQITLTTIAGPVNCKMRSAESIEVEMPAIRWIDESCKPPMWPEKVSLIDTGVPHLVVKVSGKEQLKKYKTEAAQMRSWEGLGPQGANVTFVNIHDEGSASAVSFERGVEDFTLACGTGAVAAAAYTMKKKNSKKCQVDMPGGLLEVSQVDGKYLMSGPAQFIANISINKESFL